jgi:hypothetical protein
VIGECRLLLLLIAAQFEIAAPRLGTTRLFPLRLEKNIPETVSFALPRNK